MNQCKAIFASPNKCDSWIYSNSNFVETNQKIWLLGNVNGTMVGISKDNFSLSLS